MVEVGRRLAAARRLRGMTMQEVGRSAGASPSTVSNVEFGRRMTRFEIVVGIADALEVPLADLLAGIPDVGDQVLRELWAA